MRVTHRNCAKVDDTDVRHINGVLGSKTIGNKRDFLRGQLRFAHVDHDLSVVGQVQLHDTAGCLNTNIAFACQVLVVDETGKTTCSVATVFNFTAVGIENPVLEIDIRTGWLFNDQQLVEADTKVTVRQFGNTLRANVRTLRNQVNDNEVVTDTMHLAEFKPHILSLYPG